MNNAEILTKIKKELERGDFQLIAKRSKVSKATVTKLFQNNGGRVNKETLILKEAAKIISERVLIKKGISELLQIVD